MEKKVFAVLLAILVIVMIISGLMYITKRKFKFELSVPEAVELQSISLKRDNEVEKYKNKEDIEEIIIDILGEKRETKIQSIQDEPVNIDSAIEIEFEYKNTGASRIFVYKKGNKYYIEQAYNGIYKISKKEYENIEKYLIARE